MTCDPIPNTIEVGRRSGVPSRGEGGELRMDALDRPFDPLAILREVHPPADPGGMRQRNCHRVAYLESLSDRRVQARDPEQPSDREPADGDDQPRPQQRELPLAPERAELLLAGGRRPVTAAAGCPARIA